MTFCLSCWLRLTVRYDSFLEQGLPHADHVVSAERIVVRRHQVHQPVDELAAGRASPDHGPTATCLPVPEHGVLIAEQQRPQHPTGSGHRHAGVLRRRNDNVWLSQNIFIHDYQAENYSSASMRSVHIYTYTGYHQVFLITVFGGIISKTNVSIIIFCI